MIYVKIEFSRLRREKLYVKEMVFTYQKKTLS